MVFITEAKVMVTAGVILAATLLCSCNQTQPHHQPVLPQPVTVPTNPEPPKAKVKPKPKPQGKSITGKHVIEPDRKIKRPHRIELPSAKVSKPHTPSFSVPQQPETIQPIPEPRIAEVALPKKEDPPQAIDPVAVIPSETEINELPKIEKVKPLISSTEPATGSGEDATSNDAVIIDANNATRIIDAKGRAVVVEGSDGLILITGGTDQLVVKGDSNQIQCDSATDLLLSGDNNNVVLDKFGGGEVTGDSNKVSWEKGLIGGFNPIVSDTGSKNEVGAN